MSDANYSNEDSPMTNALQVIALDAMITVGAIVWFKGLGFGWPGAVGIGLPIGAVATFFVLGAIVFVQHKRHAQRAAPTDQHGQNSQALAGPALVPLQVTDAKELWDADRMMEFEFAAVSKASQIDRIPRRVTRAEMVTMWDEDKNEENTTIEDAARANGSDAPVDKTRRRVGRS